MTKELSEKRKADRQKMAEGVNALIAKYKDHGITAETEYGVKGGYPNERQVWVKIKTEGGLCLTVDFDGESCQPDVHLLSWYMDFESDCEITENFPAEVNKQHRRKATQIAYGYEDLLKELTCAFDCIADKKALYLPL